MDGFPQEMAVDFRCDECGEKVARGDASRIGYCGACGREWHPGDSDYPTAWRVFVPLIHQKATTTRKP
jgi:ribosomal protein L37AE/L43A